MYQFKVFLLFFLFLKTEYCANFKNGDLGVLNLSSDQLQAFCVSLSSGLDFSIGRLLELKQTFFDCNNQNLESLRLLFKFQDQEASPLKRRLKAIKPGRASLEALREVLYYIRKYPALEFITGNSSTELTNIENLSSQSLRGDPREFLELCIKEKTVVHSFGFLLLKAKEESEIGSLIEEDSVFGELIANVELVDLIGIGNADIFPLKVVKEEEALNLMNLLLARSFQFYLDLLLTAKNTIFPESHCGKFSVNSAYTIRKVFEIHKDNLINFRGNIGKCYDCLLEKKDSEKLLDVLKECCDLLIKFYGDFISLMPRSPVMIAGCSRSNFASELARKELKMQNFLIKQVELSQSIEKSMISAILEDIEGQSSQDNLVNFIYDVVKTKEEGIRFSRSERLARIDLAIKGLKTQRNKLQLSEETFFLEKLFQQHLGKQI